MKDSFFTSKNLCADVLKRGIVSSTRKKKKQKSFFKLIHDPIYLRNPEWVQGRVFEGDVITLRCWPCPAETEVYCTVLYNVEIVAEAYTTRPDKEKTRKSTVRIFSLAG